MTLTCIFWVFIYKTPTGDDKFINIYFMKCDDVTRRINHRYAMVNSSTRCSIETELTLPESDTDWTEISTIVVAVLPIMKRRARFESRRVVQNLQLLANRIFPASSQSRTFTEGGGRGKYTFRYTFAKYTLVAVGIQSNLCAKWALVLFRDVSSSGLERALQ